MLIWFSPILGGVLFLAIAGVLYRRGAAMEWEEVLSGRATADLAGLRDFLRVDRDLAVRLVADGRDGSTLVREVMSSQKIATCRPDEDLDHVMDTMAREQVRRIPIVDERGSLVGIVAQADVVRKARDDRKAEETIERISEPGGQHTR